MPFEDCVLYLSPPPFFSIKFFPHVTLLTVRGADKSLLGLSGQRTEESYQVVNIPHLFIFLFSPSLFPTFTIPRLINGSYSCQVVFLPEGAGLSSDSQLVSQAVILTGGYLSLIPSPSPASINKNPETGGEAVLEEAASLKRHLLAAGETRR